MKTDGYGLILCIRLPYRRVVLSYRRRYGRPVPHRQIQCNSAESEPSVLGRSHRGRTFARTASEASRGDCGRDWKDGGTLSMPLLLLPLLLHMSSNKGFGFKLGPETHFVHPYGYTSISHRKTCERPRMSSTSSSMPVETGF